MKLSGILNLRGIGGQIAALVVGSIDEDKLQAQAFTRERKLAVAERSGIEHSKIAVMSVFTTLSSSAIFLKLGDHVRALPVPEPASFLLGTGGTRSVFAVPQITAMTFNRDVGTNPATGVNSVVTGSDGIRDTGTYGYYRVDDFATRGKVGGVDWPRLLSPQHTTFLPGPASSGTMTQV